MKPVFIVQPSEAEKARMMEKKLLSLPDEAGILFVGITVMPDPLEVRRRPLYRVVIGCHRDRETQLMHAVATQFLRPFVEDDRQLLIEAHRGIDKSCLSS